MVASYIILTVEDKSMATNHKFKATSASMSVGAFNFVGNFVLNGSVNAEGVVNITPSRNPR
jgi:hypothetical protein